MTMRVGLIAGAMCLAVPAPAAAQIIAPAPLGCEIHVWPATRFNTLTEGAFFNNTLDSGFNQRPRKVDERAVPPHGALDTGNQLQMLSSLDLPTLLRSPGARVIIHDEPARRRSVGPATGRQTASTSGCYMELTVAKNFFNRSGMTERTLRSLFVLDDYGSQQMPKRSFVAWAATILQIFPAKDPAQAQVADNELASAFRSNVRQFAQFAFTPPKKK